MIKHLIVLGLVVCSVLSIDNDLFNNKESQWRPSARTEILSLPGWKGPLPSRMYSGFTYAGIPPGYPTGSMQVHYWFVESENKPATDPVIVWYQGGPGAGSLFGLLVEFGPLQLNELSLESPIYNETGIPQLIYNPYSWSKVANLLIVDNPPPVGFSFCYPVGPSGDGRSCGPWNDSLIAPTNHMFLVNWFKDFPEFVANDLYIIGESYAGIYVPVIVGAILDDPKGLNLRGFAVGDGCLGTDVLCSSRHGPYYSIEFMHGHGQFSNELYRTIVSTCPEKDLRSGNLSEICKSLVSNMWSQIGGYYEYNLYDDCINRNSFQNIQKINSRKWWSKAYPFSSDDQVRVGAALNDYPCSGTAYKVWLNRTDVRLSINVPVNSFYFSGDDGAGFEYTYTVTNLLPFYEHVIKHTDLRVLVYNGDSDPAINSFVTQDLYFDYFKSVDITQKQPWRPWTLNGKQRMGGYVTQFEGDFTFLTIRGSGHMVPEYKPEATLTFLKAFLKNTPLPAYVPAQK